MPQLILHAVFNIIIYLFRMERDPKQVLEYLEQVESAAEEVLSDRQEIVELDKKRQDTRMAARIVKTNKNKDKKQWVCIGKMFMKLPTPHTAELLDRDYKNLDTEINTLRDGLKVKMDKLRDLENKPALQGFHLNSLSRQEFASFDSVTKKV